MAARARLVLLIVAALAATATALVAFLPELSFAYRSTSVRVATEAGGAVAGMIAAFLVYGRVARGGSVADVILCAALVALAVSNVARAFAPSYDGHDNAVVWAPVAGSIVVAAGALAAATLSPDVRIGHRSRGVLYVAGILIAGGAIVGVVSALANHIPTGVDPMLSPTSANRAIVEGSAPLLTLQVVAACAYAAAALGFARRAEQRNDEFMAWLALGTVFAGVARLNYFLFPSVYSHWIFTGDIFRGLAYVMILVGASREVAAHQRTVLRDAVVAERQRIARDLHDGVAQDLAYLSMQGGRAGHDDEVAGIARTAQEALVQSRAVIANLRLSDVPLGAGTVGLAQALTARHGTRLVLDVDEAIDARPEERDDLLWVLSEAISTALRHGATSELRVSLERRRGSGLVMSIADNGSEFDPRSDTGSRAPDLDSMRARIEGHGGSVRLRSSPGAGTALEVVFDRSRRSPRHEQRVER